MATCVVISESGAVISAPDVEMTACPSVLLSSSEYSEWQRMASTSVDYVEAGQVFSFFFFTTFGLWVLAKNCGIVLQAIRRF